MYQFLGIIYYFSIVWLPAKRDYWTTNPYMPYHEITHELGMNRNRFEFMWRHFHINVPEEDDELEGDKESNEDDDNDGEGVELSFDRVQCEQQNNDEGATEDEEVLPKKNVWYSKLSMLINHVCDVSYACIYILGTILSFDEMMIRFCGWSVETHRMQNARAAI